MPLVSIQIANRTYELTCGDGEEERVQELAAYVDEKVGELRKQLPGAPEIKLMVFASLILADESREARGMAKAAESARASATDSAETLATALEDLITSRVDKMSKKVSGAAWPLPPRHRGVALAVGRLGEGRACASPSRPPPSGAVEAAHCGARSECLD